MEAVFLWCIVWSFGAALVERSQCEDRSAFDAFLKRLSGSGLVDGEKIPVTQLPSNSLFDYNFDLETLQWTVWDQYLTPYSPPLSGKFSDIFVPTVDTIRSV